MTHRTYDVTDSSIKAKGGYPNVAEAGQARATAPFEVSDIDILKFIAKELASRLSSLSETFKISPDDMKSRLQLLASRGLVRAQGMLDSPSAVYSVTQDGAKKLEK